MGFWVFILIVVLLIPVVMIGFGRLFMNRAPKKINSIFGYRSKRSMQNEETWAFAHHYIGKLWFVIGFVLIPVSAAPLLFMIGGDYDTVGVTGAAVMGVQMIVLIVSILLTERALKKHFDPVGRYKGE